MNAKELLQKFLGNEEYKHPDSLTTQASKRSNRHPDSADFGGVEKVISSLVELEGLSGVCIPRDLEEEFNRAVSRKDVQEARVWAGRIKERLLQRGLV